MGEVDVARAGSRSGRGFGRALLALLVLLLVSVVVAGARVLSQGARAGADHPIEEGESPSRARPGTAPVPVYRRFAPRSAVTAEPVTPARPEITATEARELLVREIQDTGRTSAPWAQQATQAFTATIAALAPDLAARVHIGGVNCYTSGCMLDVEYNDAGAARELDEAMLRPESEVSRWSGTKHRSPLTTRAGGGLAGTWVLFANSETSKQGERR